MWVTLLVALLVLAADVVVLARRGGGGSALPASVAVERALVEESPEQAARRARERDAAVDALFDRRAAAIRNRDLDAFLRDLDPQQGEFVARQREVFTSLGKLDFAAWSYERDGESYSPGDIDFARYGAIQDVWLPVLTLRYQLKGFDVDEVGRRVVYTVVRRRGTWYIGGDTDLENITSSGTSVRVDPWENGPIVVERTKSSLVIGHPEDRAAIGAIRKEVDRALRHVVSYVGRKRWNRKVVVVLPTDDDELDRILENPTTFFEFAAVARHLTTAPRKGEDERLAGSRVVINPEGFEADSEFTKQLIRHEITHVAMLDRVGPLSPKWLVEGVAEYVGNAGAGLATDVLAAELAEEVRKNGVPTSLPTDSDFGLINDAGIGYNGAWLLSRYIASRWGRAKLLAFHDEMGTPTGLRKPGEKLPGALRKVLGITEDELLAGWRRYVRAALADLDKLLVNPGSGYTLADRGRLTVRDLAEQEGIPAKTLTAAGVDRVAAAYWRDGDASAPRRRAVTTVVVSQTHAGAEEVERLLGARLRPFDAGRFIPNGRVYYVGTTIRGRHYNETIAVVRTGTVVIEARVAVPGTGNLAGETRALAAAQLARFA